MNDKMFWFFMLAICIIGAVLRLYKIESPVADWHSWRQADTAAVARNFLRFGVDPLRPRYDDLSNIQSGKDNPMGYRMVEFPLYQVLGVWVYRVLKSFGLSIEIALRVVSIIASVISIVALGWLGKHYGNRLIGMGSAFFFAILPFSVFYGRSILPEPLMVSLSLMSLMFAHISRIHTGHNAYVFAMISAIFASLALLVKPFAIFLLIPLAWMFLARFRCSWRSIAFYAIMFVIAIGPLFLWRQWIANFPEGIPAYTWLLNEGNIRFKGAWFYWLFAERIGKLILGYWGVAVFVLGFLRKESIHDRVWSFFLVLGSLLYLIVIARGNVQHDYYQILLLPCVSFFLAKGSSVFLYPPGVFYKTISRLFFIVVIAFTCAFSWYHVRGFYWINKPEIIEAGGAIHAIAPLDAKVIAPYNGDTTFLYQTKRQGWPIGFDIEQKIAQGATYYVTINPFDAETEDLAKRYRLLVRNDRFAIIELQ